MRVFKYWKMVDGWQFTEWIDLNKVIQVRRFDDSGGLNYIQIRMAGDSNILRFSRADGQVDIALDFIKQIEEFWNKGVK